MSTILQLIPLVILFAFIGAVAWVGYQVRPPDRSGGAFSGAGHATNRSQIFLYSNDLAAHGKRQMAKSNISFSKDGMQVKVKNVKGEDIEDRTQR
jgi:hypothetical protein